MLLQVIGNPTYNATDAQQKVIVQYNPIKKFTMVNCDVDIVTLGIAVNVLIDQYEKALRKLSPDMATKIRETTREAVMINERD